MRSISSEQVIFDPGQLPFYCFAPAAGFFFFFTSCALIKNGGAVGSDGLTAKGSELFLVSHLQEKLLDSSGRLGSSVQTNRLSFVISHRLEAALRLSDIFRAELVFSQASLYNLSSPDLPPQCFNIPTEPWFVITVNRDRLGRNITRIFDTFNV